MRNPINRRREHITFSKIEIQTLILDDSECLLLLNLDRINFRPTTTKKIITKEARRLCTNAWVEFGEKKAAYKREKIFRFDLCFVEAKRNYYVFCCCCFFFYTCHKKRISTPGFGDIILVFSIFFFFTSHWNRVSNRSFLPLNISYLLSPFLYFPFSNFYTRT